MDIIDFLPCSMTCLPLNLVARLSIYIHISRICIAPFGVCCSGNDWTICCVMLWWKIEVIDCIRSSSLGIEDHFNHASTASINKSLTAKQKMGEGFRAPSPTMVMNEVIEISERRKSLWRSVILCLSIIHITVLVNCFFWPFFLPEYEQDVTNYLST